MYTFLDHGQIIQALIWVCEKAVAIFRKKGKRGAENHIYITLSKQKDIKTKKHTISWSRVKKIDEHYTITVDDLLLIAQLDNDIYQMRRRDIFKQIRMSYLFYANAKCAYG